MAGPRIGEAHVAINLENAQFVRGAAVNAKALRRQRAATRRYQRALRSFNATAKQTVRSIFSMQTALALLSGAGGAGLALVIKRQSDYGAELTKFSNGLGISVTALQGYQKEFELASFSTQTANTGLQRFSRRLGEAGSGIGVLVPVFKELGITIKNNDGTLRNTEDVLDDFRVALSKVGSEQDILRLSTAAFDTEGALLGKVLADNYRLYGSQANALFGLNSLTQEQVSRLNALNTTYAVLANTVRTGLAASAAEAAETFEGINTYLARVIPRAFDGLIATVEVVFDNVGKVNFALQAMFTVWLTRTNFARIIGGWFATQLAVKGVTAAMLSLITATKVFLRTLIVPAIILGIVELVQYLMRARVGYDEAAEAQERFNRGVRPATQAEFFAQQARDARDAAAAINEAAEAQRLAAMAQATSVNDEFAGINPTRGQFSRAMIQPNNRDDRDAPVGGAGLVLQELPQNELLQGNVELLNQLHDAAQRRVADAMQVTALIGLEATEAAKLQAVYEINQEFLVRRTDLERQLATAIADMDAIAIKAADDALANLSAQANAKQALIDLEYEAIDAMKANSDAADILNEKQMAHASIAMSAGQAVGEFARSSITDVSSISDAFENLTQSIIDSIIQALIIDRITSFATGLFGGVGAAQHGGRHQGLTLVGEAGPELVDFRSPARVYTNEDLSNAISGGGGDRAVTINFAPNIQSSDGPGVQAALAAALPLIESRIVESVQLGLSRPGDLRRSARG